GRAFVVAPVLTTGGAPLAWANDRFSVALYPFVEGQSFAWGEFSTLAHRRGLLDLIIGVHTAPAAARRHAAADDFTVPYRAGLEGALAAPGTPESGPSARPAALLLAASEEPVQRLLAHYDDLVTGARRRPSRTVLTHGEPHPGNTMLSSGRWLLIDWDTALAAPPERDLWSLDPGDGSILDSYADATGV